MPGSTLLNTRYHRPALLAFMLVIVLHWVEHIVQAIQIYALHWPRPAARGVLGLYFPWLISSEVLHYAFALVMLIGLFVLRHGFTGTARRWWSLALVLQFWHHIEHLLLIVQTWTPLRFPGQAAPSSVLQLLVPRVELHLFYNTIVTIPMVIAVVIHMRATDVEQACQCARTAPTAPPVAAVA